MMSSVDLNMMNSLSRLALARENSLSKSITVTQVKKNQKSMKRWALQAPMNYQHKYDLVEAELCRLTGKNQKADSYYEKAIQGARKNLFLQDEAAALEIHANFLNITGKQEYGQFCLSKAAQCYKQWGAVKKVRAMEKDNFHLYTSNIDTKRTNSEPQNIDLYSIL